MRNLLRLVSGPRRWRSVALAGGVLLCASARADVVGRPSAVLDLTAAPPVLALVAQESAGAIAIVGSGSVQAPLLAPVIAEAALRTGVPEGFLLRLLRQESGLNPQAVSRKGALGIAQFMPATAAERGLDDPFDPLKAIPKAAELLRDLRGRYGNWGLAAAAYNAGPGRIDAWLLGRGELPRETLAYVARITGVDAPVWASGQRWTGLGWPSFALLAATGGGKSAGAPILDIRSRPNGPEPLPLSGRRGGAMALGDASGRQARTPLRFATRAGHRSSRTDPCAALLNSASQCLVYSQY